MWAKLLVGFGTALAVLATGTVVVTLLLASRYDRAVHRANLLDSSARVRPSAAAAAPPAHIVGPLNFLVLGSDARSGDTVDGERSDTIIIVHIPAGMDRAYFISVPRDLRVHIPADADLDFPGSTEKINGAFNHGGGGVAGFQLVSKTLTALTGLRFDGAAVIDFTGFQQVVRLLGGVDMCVDQETRSIHTNAVYHVGCQHLAPWQALDYVRQRKTLPDGDFDRQRHQQQFLKAILKDAKDQGLLRDPVKLDQLVRSVGDSLIVDTNGVSLVDLVLALRGIQPFNVDGVRIPCYDEWIGGVSYELAYQDQAAALYQAIAADNLDAWAAANPSWMNRL